ncbi:hypothetical protein [Actinoplanes sp. NPDC049802]|uniref:hypothetical protein n=1 Tax=Actinoplanes sp. NPDC049802 TaxID=3154742 RepID=UPI0033FAE930
MADGPTEPLGAVRPPEPAEPVTAPPDHPERADATPRGRPSPDEAGQGGPATENTTDRGEPGKRIRKAPRRATVALAVLLSLLALAGSGVALLLAWRTTQKAAVAPGPSPARPDEYRVSYAKEPLRIQLACAAVLHLDLDEPRADAAENLADLRYESRCGTQPPQLSLGAGAAGGSRHASADTDAEGCDRAIRTSPLGQGLRVEVTKGTALCVLTAATPAELVLVEIIDVGGSGTAGLRATSWQVPKGR